MIKEIKDNSPNERLIQFLEEQLKQAKEGKIRTAMIICGWHDDTVSTGWEIDERNSLRRLAGELLLAQHELINSMQLAEEDSVLYRALNDV